MRRLVRLAAVFSVFAASACATMDTGSFVDREVDFSRYHTYNWGPATRESSGDPRLDRNPVFKDQLQGEVEKQLAAKGLRGPIPRRPDLLIRYRTAVTERMNVNGVESGYGYPYGYCSTDCGVRIVEYEKATLVLDIIDARTKKVLWRGWAQDNLDDVLDNQDRMARRIHDAITQMLAKFPAEA